MAGFSTSMVALCCVIGFKFSNSHLLQKEWTSMTNGCPPRRRSLYPIFRPTAVCMDDLFATRQLDTLELLLGSSRGDYSWQVPSVNQLRGPSLGQYCVYCNTTWYSCDSTPILLRFPNLDNALRSHQGDVQGHFWGLDDDPNDGLYDDVLCTIISRRNGNKTRRAISKGVERIVQSALKKAEIVSTLLMPRHTLRRCLMTT